MSRRRRQQSLAYREAVLALNPAGYWRLGELSGTVAADEVGISAGTYVNAPTLGVTGLLTGDPNTAATFAAASSQRVDFGSGAALDATTSVTIAAWLTKAAPPAADQRIFSRRGIAASYVTGYELYAEGATGRPQSFFGDGTANASTVVTVNVCDGMKHLVVMVRSGNAVTCYIDGVVRYANATLCSGVGSMAGTITAQLGAYNLGGYGGYLTGTPDEPAVWIRALSAAEVSGLYAAGT